MSVWINEQNIKSARDSKFANACIIIKSKFEPNDITAHRAVTHKTGVAHQRHILNFGKAAA
jgi:7,8-dihydro-6-hydroxymethylpterin-pyrophosphokinase